MNYELANSLFLYDKIIGSLHWKIRPCNRVHIGDEAGSFNGLGYRYIEYKGKCYQTHRLVWLLHHGKFPDDKLDHIDNNPRNSRIENLRECTQTQNCYNQKLSKANTTGFKGVTFVKGKYVASIRYNKKLIYIGTFNGAEEAAIAYDTKAIQLFGKFANPNNRNGN